MTTYTFATVRSYFVHDGPGSLLRVSRRTWDNKHHAQLFADKLNEAAGDASRFWVDSAIETDAIETTTADPNDYPDM